MIKGAMHSQIPRINCFSKYVSLENRTCGGPITQTCSRGFSCRSVGVIPVLFCLALILWGYRCLVFIIVPSNEFPESLRIPTYVICHILLVLLVICYARTVFTDPGRVEWDDEKFDFRPPLPARLASDRTLTSPNDPHASSSADRLVPASSSSPGVKASTKSTELMHVSTSRPARVFMEIKGCGSIRFCRQCNAPKPDRAHHCSTCGRCVLKLDHHCPWVWNCVGFRNYKYFVLFIFYTAAYDTLIFASAVGTLAVAVRESIASFTINLVPYEHFAVTLMSFVVMLAVWPLSIYHMYLIARNKTTLESISRYTHIRHLDSRRKLVWRDSYPNLYNRGAKRNILEVFGSRPWLWFLPVWSSLGDGINFAAGERALDKYNSIVLEEIAKEQANQTLATEKVFEPKDASQGEKR